MRIIQSENPRPLNLLAVGPTGLVAAASGTFGAGGDVEVWDATSGHRRYLFPGGVDPIAGIALTPDGRFLFVAGSRCLFVIDGTVPPPTEGQRFSIRTHAMAVSEDGTRIVAAGSGVECWAVITDPVYERTWGDAPHDFLSVWRADEPHSAPAVSRDCSRVAVVERISGPIGRPVQALVVRHGDIGTRLLTIPCDPAGPVRQLAFTADGTNLLVRTESNNVQLFDASTGAPGGALTHRGRPHVTGIAVHPRGPAACARTNGTVTFWDVETRAPVRTLDWKAGRLVSVAFAPDGSLAAAGTEDGKIVVWDVE